MNFNTLSCCRFINAKAYIASLIKQNHFSLLQRVCHWLPKESQPSSHLSNKGVEREAAIPFCATCSRTASEALERTSLSKQRWVGRLLPGRHCGGKMWVQVRFQKQMSNLHFSVWSKRREHAAASSKAGRGRPKGAGPGTSVVTEMLLYWSQNRLVLSAFGSLSKPDIPEDTSHKAFCFISKMSEIPVLKWVGISVTAPCSHVSPRTDQKVGTKHPCCCLQGTPARAVSPGYPGRRADSDRHDLAFLHQISKHLTDTILLMSTLKRVTT